MFFCVWSITWQADRAHSFFTKCLWVIYLKLIQVFIYMSCSICLFYNQVGVKVPLFASRTGWRCVLTKAPWCAGLLYGPILHYYLPRSLLYSDGALEIKRELVSQKLPISIRGHMTQIWQIGSCRPNNWVKIRYKLLPLYPQSSPGDGIVMFGWVPMIQDSRFPPIQELVK